MDHLKSFLFSPTIPSFSLQETVTLCSETPAGVGLAASKLGFESAGLVNSASFCSRGLKTAPLNDGPLCVSQHSLRLSAAASDVCDVMRASNVFSPAEEGYCIESLQLQVESSCCLPKKNDRNDSPSLLFSSAPRSAIISDIEDQMHFVRYSGDTEVWVLVKSRSTCFFYTIIVNLHHAWRWEGRFWEYLG